MHILPDTKAYIIQVTTKDTVFMAATAFSHSVATNFVENARDLDRTLNYYQGLFYNVEDKFFETHGEINDEDDKLQALYEQQVEAFFNGLDLPDGINDYDTLIKLVMEYQPREYDVVETPIIMPDKNSFN
jgi:general stress protein 26